MSHETVSIRRCPSHSTDAQIVATTLSAIQALPDYDRSLRSACCIAIKVNAGVDRRVLTDGRQTELTDPGVVEGTVRAIREVTTASILLGDAPTHGNAMALYDALGYPARLSAYADVELLDFGAGELVDVACAHTAPLMRKYTLNKLLSEADTCVSIAKMKAHAGMGVTLSIKNLFGLIPPSVYGAPRHYLHDRLIRLPYTLVDLAALLRPCLNVVDGIVAANHSEWNGTPLRPGLIIAGANAVAVDSAGARCMGVDPESDYPDHPWHYRRNAILLAAQAGLGPTAMQHIQIVGPEPAEVAIPFTVARYGESDRNAELQRGAACVRRYRDQQVELSHRYGGRYLAMRDGRVMWDAASAPELFALERTAGLDWQTGPEFNIRCMAPEHENERLELYDLESARLANPSRMWK